VEASHSQSDVDLILSPANSLVPKELVEEMVVEGRSQSGYSGRSRADGSGGRCDLRAHHDRCRALARRQGSGGDAGVHCNFAGAGIRAGGPLLWMCAFLT